MGLGILCDEIARQSIGFVDIDLGLQDAIDESRLCVVLRIPIVHRIEHSFWAFDGDFWSFGDDIEIGIGHECGDFDAVIDARIESCHFAIDPNQRLVDATSHFDVYLLFQIGGVVGYPS